LLNLRIRQRLGFYPMDIGRLSIGGKQLDGPRAVLADFRQQFDGTCSCAELMSNALADISSAIGQKVIEKRFDARSGQRVYALLER
jgi:hypothetical protein